MTFPNQPSASPKGKILIVDDTLENLHLLSALLTAYGYQILEAANGLSGLKTACTEIPDLILLDVRMPSMDGYETCCRLKANEMTSSIPIIFVSALDEQTDKIRGFSVGGVDYVTKPFQVQEVLARVEAHLSLRNLQKQLEMQNAQLQQEVAERIHAELALQKVNEQLEQRVKERTAELALTNTQLREIMNTVPEGVYLLDSNAIVLMANPAAEANLAFLAGVGVGEKLTQLGNRPLTELLISPPEGLWHEVTMGSRSFEVISQPLQSGTQPESWVIVIREVTQAREIQLAAQRQEQLAAVGQLAAGISHDFNNILAVILLYAEMALAMPDLQPKLRERLHTIMQQAQRAAELIQQVLDFSRNTVIERHTFNLGPFVKELTKLLERTLPENIRIHLDCAPGNYMVNADPTRIQQAIMNLAVNAQDAMPEGGELKIKVSHTLHHGESKCSTCGVELHGEWISVSLTDTGIGITPDVFPHIFEPFYTTKPPGKGTGLGLSQVDGIIKQHDGHITVSAQPGSGSTFSLYMPVMITVHPQPLVLESRSLIKGERQEILLVEDDPAAQEVLAEGLALLNYQVYKAANGQGALAFLEEHAGKVDLVLSDVVMPGMGGIALFKAIEKRGWQIPVVLLTGHPMQDELEQLQLSGLSSWILKPPKLKDLAETIAHILHR